MSKEAQRYIQPEPGNDALKQILADSNPDIQNDPEALALDEELAKTAPFGVVDPLFKASLQELLKEMLPERPQQEPPGQPSSQ